MACFRSHNSVQPGLFSAGVSTMLPRRLKLASQPSDVLKAKKGYLRAMFLLCSRSRQRSNKLEFNSSTMTRRAASGFGWQRKSESGDRRLWLEDGPACAGASSGCLNLTVPLAATFGLKMLKRPILHFSARRHRAPEAIFRSRSMKFAGRLRLQRGRFESQWCVFTGIPSSRGEGEPRLSQFLRFK